MTAEMVAPAWMHQQITAEEYESWSEEQCADTDFDVRLQDVPLTNRHPDVIVYRADTVDITPTRPEHVLLVAEVVSPGSETTGRIVKLDQYAKAGRLLLADRAGRDGHTAGIFEPFQRYGDSPHGAGVGLGPAVARGFTEAIGGTLHAEDTPGGGLTMVLTVRKTRRSEGTARLRSRGRWTRVLAIRDRSCPRGATPVARRANPFP
jgi:hypothetical protein